MTSAITLLEVLVVPYRAGKVALAERYEQVLTRAAHLRLVDVDRQQVRAAAWLRAVHGKRTPDALQLAAGLAARSTTLITNDRRPPSVPGLEVLQLRGGSRLPVDEPAPACDNPSRPDRQSPRSSGVRHA
ncbi:MAG TPA: PIN domain-containing protein [Myxococcota bacterium]|nr:PIN domain-containing protein [Myxococcota bacterium]